MIQIKPWANFYNFGMAPLTTSIYFIPIISIIYEDLFMRWPANSPAPFGAGKSW